LWDDNSANYGIPYTEVYIRRYSGGTNLLANDTDANGDALAVTGAATRGVPTAGNFTTTSVLGADVQVFVNGSFNYDPSAVGAAQQLVAGQQLVDSFTYLIDDGNGGTDDATVTITVTGVSDLAADSATVAEDAGDTVIDVLANDAQAGTVITGVTIEDFSSEFPGRSAVDSINGTGLSGAVHNNSANDMWLSNNEEAPLITFDLEGVYDLANFHVWNYNESAGDLHNRGANLVEILVAGSVGGPFTSLGNFNFAIADGSSAIPGETIDLDSFPAADSSRLVRFDIMSDHGGDNYTGLSEVRFFASPVFVITSVTPNTDGGAGGSVTNNGTDVTYNPNGQFDSLNEGQTATDTFSYTITGGSSVTVTVTISGVSRGTVVRVR
ncbi:MAG: VCBS repeat-containing protein, partial [Rhodothermales bacterium]